MIESISDGQQEHSDVTASDFRVVGLGLGLRRTPRKGAEQRLQEIAAVYRDEIAEYRANQQAQPPVAE
jgi:hypothetical protein